MGGGVRGGVCVCVCWGGEEFVARFRSLAPVSHGDGLEHRARGNAECYLRMTPWARA